MQKVISKISQVSLIANPATNLFDRCIFYYTVSMDGDSSLSNEKFLEINLEGVNLTKANEIFNHCVNAAGSEEGIVV